MTPAPIPGAPSAGDLAYTPEEVAWAFVQILAEDLRDGITVWEPHAGAGAWVRALQLLRQRPGHDIDIYASDIDPSAPALQERGVWTRAWDALQGTPVADPPDWIIGNPPYSTWDAQVRLALEVARRGVAFLSIGQVMAPGRRDWLWDVYPFDACWWARERIAFGGPGRDGRSTDQREYALYVWRRRAAGWTGSRKTGRVSWRLGRVWWPEGETSTLTPLPAPLAGAAAGAEPSSTEKT